MLRLRSLGDCVLMTPSVRALKERWPRLSLAVLVERPFRDVFSDSPFVDEVIAVERGGGGIVSTLGRLAAGLHLRRSRFSAVINFHGGATSRLLMRLSGAPYRAGFDHFRGRSAYTYQAGDPSRFFGGGPLHTAQHQLGLLLGLGLPLPDPFPNPEIFIPPAARDAVRPKLAALGMEPGRFVVVHPTATLETKRWPAPAFAEFIDRVRGRFSGGVLLTCGPGEEGTAREIAARTRNPVPWIAGLSVKELAAVIDDASIFVGCDSGPTHIAAARGKKICVIFGSSDSIAWRPWGTEYRLVRLSFPCNPCPGHDCGCFDQPRCIREITPAMVFDSFCDLAH